MSLARTLTTDLAAMPQIDLRNSSCLVAGGAGFLGHYISRRLLESGARVRATLHDKPPVLTDPRIDYVRVDLNRPEDCARATRGIDYLFMAAANTQGAAVIREKPLAHVTPNVPMNTYALEAAHLAGVKRFLFLSSGAAYPDTGHRPAEEHEMLAGDPLDVYFAVAWMKRYAEILCRTYATKIRNPMSCVVVRPSNVYGPEDKYDFAVSHVTAALIRRVAERQNPLEVWGTGDDIRDLIYIDDFIDGLFAAFATPEPYLEVNICSGTGVSVKEIIQTAIEVDGFDDARVTFDPTKPSTAPVRRLSNELARERLGFEARTSLRDGLRRSLDWYRTVAMA
jgi:GDP-L-fucose synthase